VALKGSQVSLKDALTDASRILRDEFKDYPESSLYMIGSIDEAEESGTQSQSKSQPQGAKPSRRHPKQANIPRRRFPMQLSCFFPPKSFWTISMFYDRRGDKRGLLRDSAAAGSIVWPLRTES